MQTGFDIEDAIRQFEECWRSGTPMTIADFLRQFPNGTDDHAELLVELIAIDLECRWRLAGGAFPSQATAVTTLAETGRLLGIPIQPRVEDYIVAWPGLRHSAEHLSTLAVEEYRVRHRWGDRPQISEHLERFADLPDLASRLQKLEQELEDDRLDINEISASSADVGSTHEPPTCGEAVAEPVAFGRYLLIRPLGKGGMGKVWLAKDTYLERKVALKTPDLNGVGSPLHDRFLNEGKAAAALRHPNICPVFDVGEIDGQPFLTMAFIDGRTLAELWHANHDGDILESLRILAKIARAMQFAHDHGIIHRDLKPSNVMMEHHGEPIVTDFGLAWRTTPVDGKRLTQSSAFCGSPAYMSPEQVESRADDVGAATDIYSLGIMLFEAVTGRLPFQGPLGRVLTAIARDQPPRLSKYRSDVDPELQQLCLRMMARKASDRPASMDDVAERLTAIGQRLALEKPVSGSWRLPLGNRWPWVAGILFAALLAGTLLQIRTPRGLVTIDVAPEAADVEVRVLRDGRLIDIADAASGWSMTLREGDYEFRPGEGDEQFQIEPQVVSVRRDGQAIVRVSIIPDSVRDAQAVSLSPHNRALAFDGVDDQVITPVVYEGSHPLTLEAWVAPSDPYGSGAIISNSTNVGIQLHQDFEERSRSSLWSASVGDAGRWIARGVHAREFHHRRTHLALVWTGKTLSIFVDGLRQATGTAPLQAVPHIKLPLLIGGKYQRKEFGSSSDAWFHGEIDEVRISSTARYQDEFTPQQRYEPDESTLVLYHFDESEGDIAFDSSGHEHHAKISGARHVAASTMDEPGVYAGQLQHFALEIQRPQLARNGPALRFTDAETYVTVPDANVDFTQPFALEAWVTPESSFDNRDWKRVFAQIGHLSLGVQDYHDTYAFQVWDSGSGIYVNSHVPDSALIGRRSHVVGQWNGQELQLFVNGRRAPALPFHRKLSSQDAMDAVRVALEVAAKGRLTLGRRGTGRSTFGGLIDRFRLSRGVRYTEEFEPIDFTADESTVVMYDFHEGRGEVLHDLSGNGHHGAIVNALWIGSPASSQQD